MVDLFFAYGPNILRLGENTTAPATIDNVIRDQATQIFELQAALHAARQKLADQERGACDPF